MFRKLKIKVIFFLPQAARANTFYDGNNHQAPCRGSILEPPKHWQMRLRYNIVPVTEYDKQISIIMV
jgi:hypothetical protein